ncbi:hypothetical protein [Hymenobacter koreensis]|uniref:Arc family DNA-binding protein n=1 Tax=Hymenobacter koreensis TaxID=1084523 RepID=A0ABP8JN65_9BACT
MLKNQKPVIMWVPQETRSALKEVARANGEQLYQTVQRLATEAKSNTVPPKLPTP